MAKFTKLHQRRNREFVPFLDAKVDCVYYDASASKTIVNLLTDEGHGITVAFTNEEMQHIIQSQNTTHYEYRKVMK